MTEDCIDIIQKEFPDQSNPEEFVKAHRGSERTEAFAEFFQLLLDSDNVTELNDSDAEFTVTFNLGFWERIKVLVTGRYDAMVGPLLSEAVGFGICWQHQDILETLRDSNEQTEGVEQPE